MSTYKGIKGFSIQTVAGNPDNPIAGQVWYNSSTKKIRAAGPTGWASGGNLNTSRQQGQGAGSQTAGLHIGGATRRTIVEHYDGSSWTEGPDLNAHNELGGSCGTQTAAMVMGGNAADQGTTHLVTCEKYDGSSWTEVGDLNSGRWVAASCGAINSAALFVGGQNAPTPVQDNVEEWDDSSWTEVGDLNTGRFAMTGCGTTTAGMVAGGNTNPPNDAVDEVEQYNGTSWTEIADVPDSSASGMGSAGLGTQTAGFWFGGSTPGPGTAGFLWNGSAWSSTPALSTGRPNLNTMCGTSTAAMVAGNDPAANITEEYSDPLTVTFTSS